MTVWSIPLDPDIKRYPDFKELEQIKGFQRSLCAQLMLITTSSRIEAGRFLMVLLEGKGFVCDVMSLRSRVFFLIIGRFRSAFIV